MGQLIPIYYQIKQNIKNRIINKEFNPGERIPSENQLADHFKVTRLTVRQAIFQLVQEGLLEVRRGNGTFVTENENLIKSNSYESAGFVDEDFYKVQKPETRSVEIDRVSAPKYVQEKLELTQSNQMVVRFKRVRYLKNNTFNYIINYLPLEIGSKIYEKDLYQRSLLEILEKEIGIVFIEAFQTIQASFADQEISNKLKIPSGSPMLSVVRTMYAKKRIPILFSHILYRGDLFQYIARFKNVKRKSGNIWMRWSL